MNIPLKLMSYGKRSCNNQQLVYIGHTIKCDNMLLFFKNNNIPLHFLQNQGR